MRLLSEGKSSVSLHPFPALERVPAPRNVTLLRPSQTSGEYVSSAALEGVKIIISYRV